MRNGAIILSVLATTVAHADPDTELRRSQAVFLLANNYEIGASGYPEDSIAACMLAVRAVEVLDALPMDVIQSDPYTDEFEKMCRFQVITCADKDNPNWPAVKWGWSKRMKIRPDGGAKFRAENPDMFAEIDRNAAKYPAAPVSKVLTAVDVEIWDAAARDEAGDQAGAALAYDKVLGSLPDQHPSFSRAAFAAGMVDLKLSRLGQGQLWLERAVTAMEKVDHQKSPKADVVLPNALLLLAAIYALGDEVRAQTTFKRVLDVAGARDSKLMLFRAHYGLGRLAYDYEHYDAAREHYRRALEIAEKADPNSDLVVKTLLDMAVQTELPLGRIAEARKLLDRRANILNGRSWDGGSGAYELTCQNALLALATGAYSNAATDIHACFDGRRADLVAEADLNENDRRQDLYLAELYLSTGDLGSAKTTIGSYVAKNEDWIAKWLSTGSEAARRGMLRTSGMERAAVGLDLLGKEPGWLAPTAMDVVLARKGRVLDAVSDTMANARRAMSGPDRALLERLGALRGELAAGGGRETHVREVRAEIETLETEFARKYPDYRSERAVINWAHVQPAIPAGAVLVELIRYQPVRHLIRFGPETAPERYGAYVLLPHGSPKGIDLGEAAPIDQLVARFRTALASTAGDPQQAGRALEAKVFEPVRKLIGDAHTIILSPDGALNLVPFAALPTDSGRFLVEDYTIAYVASGRDLMRTHPASTATGVTVFADPDYESAGAPGKSRRVIQFSDVPRLPGTRREARAIQQLIPHAEVIDGKAATKQRVLATANPRVLHLATHGFFLDSPPIKGSRGLVRVDAPATKREDDALLQSGLVLAGINDPNSDAILTALEVTTMDLSQTELVVLSACESGVGEARAGEGVYGLRRAMALAGARSMLMSLWAVDDEATRELMTGYYKALLDGRPRAAALRDIQLAMLHGNKAHPYYWAAFIPSGDIGPLPLPTPPGFVPHKMAARGCCETGGEPAPLLVLLVVFALRRRR